MFVRDALFAAAQSARVHYPPPNSTSTVLSIREKKSGRTGADDWLASGRGYVDVKLLMEVTVVKLTETVAVQTEP
jgi:hypothetical protein